MTPTEVIKALAPKITAGHSRHISCPFCLASHEASMRVARPSDKPHILFFRCYRAACGARGYVRDGDWMLRIVPNGDEVRHTDEQDSIPGDPVPDDVMAELCDKYQIRRNVLGRQQPRWYSSPLYDALLMPYYTADGRIYRWEEKRLRRPPQMTKVLSRPIISNPGHRLCFTQHNVPRRATVDMMVVLVEGWLDAVKVTDVAEELALRAFGVALGTSHVHAGAVSAVVRVASSVLFLPDPDVNWMNMSNAMRAFASTRLRRMAVSPPDDPKDLPREVLGGILREAYEGVTTEWRF